MKTQLYKLNQWFSKPLTRVLSVVAGFSLLSACISAPETVDFDQPNTSFVRVAQAPDAFVGYDVRWGGIVARVENLEHDTLVEIVNLPLDSRARPLGNANTAGRFIARVQGFLDPLIYKQGKEITVVGILNDPMPGQIGQHQVNFPVVDSTGHHLWERRQSHQHISVFSSWDPFWFGHTGYRWRYPYYGYPRYNYCPTHGAFHHHTVRHSIRNHDRRSDSQLNAAPSPTHRLIDRRANVRDLDGGELRSHSTPIIRQQAPVIRQQVTETPRVIEKPQRIRERDIPKTPRRINPRVNEVKIPKPNRNPRNVERLR